MLLKSLYLKTTVNIS